jgi:DNA-binding GntR family transcriptional regulator
MGTKMNRRRIIKPIQTIAQQVFKILEEEILSGKYKPGDRLIEREIADRLEISRIPVREALLSLERWGLVIATGRNRKGREVIGINRRGIEENYSIKELIEAAALCEKSLKQDKNFFNGLAKLIGEMKQRVEKQDVENYRKLNWQFHHEIAKSLNNQKLYEIFCDMDKRTRWFQNLTLFQVRMERSLVEHQRMLQACREKDLQKIRALMKAHYSQAVDFLSQKFRIERKERIAGQPSTPKLKVRKSGARMLDG